jgi:hydroxyacylglutathione hydrolase
MPPAASYLDEHPNFYVHQMFTSCLAHMAYIVVSGNEAAIIDPLREIDPYLNYLKEKSLKLKYIFETHFHADFVSGHFDLSSRTGA